MKAPLGQRIGVGIALLGLVALSLYRQIPPSQDALGFSTPRAIDDLKFIASEVHSVGTPHHKAVQQFLADRFRQLGYDVRLQEGHTSIPVTNVIARRKGTRAGNKAVMLVAHYDSHRRGPGAGDDGAGVVALLEVARVLANESQANDLIFLISDAEELGMWGARVFVSEHPWSKDVGAVLNFDARGTSGPSIMFETSDGNGWLIDLFAGNAPHPVCSSVSYDVYKKMPNNTDFTVFHAEGMPGLNFAFIGGYAFYHTPQDDVEHLDLRSVRHSGLQALALTRALAEVDLVHPPQTADAVYFDLLSLTVVHYPASAAQVLAVVTFALALAALVVALRQRKIRPIQTIVAFSTMLMNIMLVVGLCWLVSYTNSGANLALHADWFTLEYSLIALLVTLIAFQFSPFFNGIEATASGMIMGMLLTLSGGFVFTGGSYLSVWPLLAMTTLFVWLLLAGRIPGWGVVVLTAIPIFILTPVMLLMFQGLTIQLGFALVGMVVLSYWQLALPLNYILGKELAYENPTRRSVDAAVAAVEPRAGG